jgi:hypothetical protein
MKLIASGIIEASNTPAAQIAAGITPANSTYAGKPLLKVIMCCPGPAREVSLPAVHPQLSPTLHWYRLLTHRVQRHR